MIMENSFRKISFGYNSPVVFAILKFLPIIFNEIGL